MFESSGEIPVNPQGEPSAGATMDLVENPTSVPQDGKLGRVMVVSHEASRTGAPRVAISLLKVLDEMGWTTAIVHRHGGPMRSALDAAADVSYNEPCWRLRGQLRRFGWERLACRLETWSAKWVLKRYRPRLVWGNTVLAAPYVLAAGQLGIPVVWYSHEQQKHAKFVLNRYRSKEVFRAAELVGCSGDASLALAAELGVSVDQVITVHPPIDRASILRRASMARVDGSGRFMPIVLAVGVGSHAKGVDVFSIAAEKAASIDLGVRWQWAGRPPNRASMFVDWLGEVDDPVPLMAAALVVVVPSRSEGFPLVVMEAMAAGAPLVCSDLPGIREQVDDAGLLVPPGDAGALLEGVTMLVSDEQLRSRLEHAARERSARFSLVAFAQAVALASERAMTSKSRPF